jgi:hypothetical protein
MGTHAVPSQRTEPLILNARVRAPLPNVPLAAVKGALGRLATASQSSLDRRKFSRCLLTAIGESARPASAWRQATPAASRHWPQSAAPCRRRSLPATAANARIRLKAAASSSFLLVAVAFARTLVGKRKDEFCCFQNAHTHWGRYGCPVWDKEAGAAERCQPNLGFVLSGEVGD